MKHLLVDNNRPYMCQGKNCFKKFTNKYTLMEHNKIYHIYLKNYKCEYCNSGFEYEKTMLKHSVKHWKWTQIYTDTYSGIIDTHHYHNDVDCSICENIKLFTTL